MTHYLFTIILLLLGCGSPDTPPAVKPAETTVAAPQDSMSSAAFVMSLQVYKVGLIGKGANWSADAPAKLQEMAKKNAEPWRQAIIDGSLVGVVDPDEIVSVLFFKKQTDESMKAMAANAPAVKAGLVTARVEEVWGTKGLGAGLPDKAAADSTMTAKKETYYMVYTTKGKNWSADSESPETRKATDEQIQYLYGLHKGGQMKYFGVFTDMRLKIRGFGIFKTATEKEALDLMAKSPSVQKGMLDAGVKTVEIAEGTLK
jgi:hypothetical protein